MLRLIYKFWKMIKQLSGDDAYERYLSYQARVPTNGLPLSRKAFFKQRMDDKWNKITRCC